MLRALLRAWDRAYGETQDEDMMTKLNLPTTMDFDDYHDINTCGRWLKEVIPSIKWEEIGFYGGSYVGVYYTKKDAAFKRLVKLVEAMDDGDEE